MLSLSVYEKKDFITLITVTLDAAPSSNLPLTFAAVHAASGAVVKDMFMFMFMFFPSSLSLDATFFSSSEWQAIPIYP
jgi:hypothetical protein